jgi:3-hydroxyisobutyrate dehydrogenase-like beta-hydroxyacid dehydrogenase
MGTARIAVLGLGEAGMEVARDLVAAGVDLRGYDPVVEAPEGAEDRVSDADAVRDADLVLCLTTAHESRVALENSLASLRPGVVWADLNTASPTLKSELAAIAADRDVLFADVSLLAEVPGRGLRTPMEVCGPGADRFAALLGQHGAGIVILDGPAGTAASRKLLRSVFFKGLAAAVLEALEGARAAGCEPWLHDNIAAQLRAFDETTIDRLVDGSRRHARRRGDEMAAAERQLLDLGVEPRITAATRETLQALAATIADSPSDVAEPRPAHP